MNLATAWTEPPRRTDVLFVRADPNGLAYDRERDAVLVADARSGAVLRLDGSRCDRLAKIDSGGVVAADRIAGIAVASDGAVYVTRLGYGRAGAIARIDAGVVDFVRGQSPQRWRIGLCDAGDGGLLVTEFARGLGGPHDGAVVHVDPDTGRSEPVLTGLAKPVGVAVVGTCVVATDAVTRRVWAAERGGTPRVLAEGLGRPDSVAALGDSAVVLTAYDPDTKVGTVFRLGLDGDVAVLWTGAHAPRGIATDGVRAYVALRRASRVVVVPCDR
jgi:sugar lactone lactonase YvrE